jgi:hypothetical protein
MASALVSLLLASVSVGQVAGSSAGQWDKSSTERSSEAEKSASPQAGNDLDARKIACKKAVKEKKLTGEDKKRFISDCRAGTLPADR